MTDSILLLKPNKWQEFQHYKDRCPPWIKIHRDLLTNKDYMRLPLASKALAPLLWLLASESKDKDGAFDGSTEELAFRLHMVEKDVEAGRKPLIDKGFFHVASAVLAECQQVAIPETETETEGETETDGFASFWSIYPKKTAKPAAAKAFKSARINGHLPDVLTDIENRAQSADWRKEGGKYIPHPATYLNQRRWEDAETNAPILKNGILAGAI